MFHIMKGQELDEKLLLKMLTRYRESVAPAIKKAQGYYDGEQAILQKAYADPTKPCSRTVTMSPCFKKQLPIKATGLCWQRPCKKPRR